MTIVNVYPRALPIDNDEVQIFAKVLNDIGASKGIMVCNAVFTRSAKSLAPSLGIALSSIQDVRTRKWKEDIKTPVFFTKLSPAIGFNFTINLEAGEIIPSDFSKIRFSCNEGISTFNVIDIFINLWDRKLISHKAIKKHCVKLDTKNWWM